MNDIRPILAAVSCDFLRPIVFPATVCVGAKVTEIGNTSLRMEHVVVCADAPETLCATGASVIVMVRYPSLEKVRVADELRAAVAAIEASAPWSTRETGRA